MWESRLAYDNVRIDEKTWLVACLEPDPMQNAVEPQYHRCRTVKLVDGCHLECDCKQMTWLGIACPHILCITDEVHESCWITRWWNEFVFYCRRPGVSKEISQAWEDLAFNSPKQPGVLFRNVPKADQYPVLSDPSVPLERFIDLRDSPVPVVLNYDPETIAVALERIKSRMPSVGMSVEMDFADGHNPDEFTFPTGDDGDDNGAVPFPDSKADDLYFSMKAYAGSISKQNPDGPMRREIEHVLAELAVKSMLRAEGKYDPPTAEELAQRSANVTGLPDSKKGDEDEDESSSQYLSFCSQVPAGRQCRSLLRSGCPNDADLACGSAATNTMLGKGLASAPVEASARQPAVDPWRVQHQRKAIIPSSPPVRHQRCHHLPRNPGQIPGCSSYRLNNMRASALEMAEPIVRPDGNIVTSASRPIHTSTTAAQRLSRPTS
mmetsp:Transcript_10704/g.25238  ORF Transcript_10704/g.25238 Transcript_10704/m.25238 type:complete len:436 (+) Transcript_10704:444-1751(+)